MLRIDRFSNAIMYISLLAFIIFAGYIFHVNLDVFYIAHERSEFLFGTPFFCHLASRPFGLMQYAGGWFTQMFFHPVLGLSVLATIWVLIYFVGTKAFRLQGSASALMLLPVACLLTSVVDLGYWVYFLPIDGYWFSQSLGLLAMLLLLWLARFAPRRFHFLWYLAGFCLYPILGWFTLLFVACLALSERITWRELLAVAVLIFTANIWHGMLYSNMRFDNVVLAGLPRFVTPSDRDDNLSLPFWFMAVILVLIPLCSKHLNRWFVPVLCAATGIYYISSNMYSDINYYDEMRMSRQAEAGNWKEVAAVAERASKPTTSMMILKNIALMNEGTLLDRSFKMGNEVYPMHNPDSVHVSFLEIAAPLAYYNYGMLNEGFRLSFECAVQSGFSPVYLKMLARTAHANGEDKLAGRYIEQLHHHPFYRDWQPEETSKIITQLHRSYQDEITGVESSDGYIVNSISLWYDSDSKLASEQALFYSMMRRDANRFWVSFRKFIMTHMGEEFPVSVAEAYVMYMDKKPEKKRVMVPVSEQLVSRYKQFWASLEQYAGSGMSKESVAEKMRLEYGDTYWYYNLFSRRVY